MFYYYYYNGIYNETNKRKNRKKTLQLVEIEMRNDNCAREEK